MYFVVIFYGNNMFKFIIVYDNYMIIIYKLYIMGIFKGCFFWCVYQ